jgi:hypothetical protein
MADVMNPPTDSWVATWSARPAASTPNVRPMGVARARFSEAWRRRRRLGASDCEEIRPGLIAQPANAVSSLSYVAAGGWVARRGLQAGRPAAMAFGALLAAVGVGSVLYHGPCPPGAQQAHDTSLAATLGLVVLHNSIAVMGLERDVPDLLQIGAAVGAAVPVLPRGRHTNSLVALLGAAAVTTEVISVRAGSHGPRPAAAAGVGLALGAAVLALSRTGGPLCRPKSLLQGHALWHLLSATSLAAWARGALLTSSNAPR